MRVWLAVLPAAGVLLSGCARQERRAPVEPGPRMERKITVASIIAAEPSPTGTALVVELAASGAVIANDRMTLRQSGVPWLVDLRTGAVRNLSSASDQRPPGPPDPRLLAGSSPSWRPDGGALALGTPEGRIVIHEVASGSSRIVSPEGLWCHTPSWSPDGKRLAFAAAYNPPGRTWQSPGAAYVAALYVVPSDGSAPPRLQVTGLASRIRWWWSADGRRLRYAAGDGSPAGRAGPGSIAEPVSSDEVIRAYQVAWSPGFTKLAFSRADHGGRGSVTAVVDASLRPLVEWHDADVPARGLRWSPDGRQIITRDASGRTYLLDLATKTSALVDDPVCADKEPVGWVRWNGEWQLAFIDETWKRLVITAKIGAPVYTLVTLNEDGSPVLALPVPKEN